MFALALSALFGWLIGSVPTAYLLVKRRHGLDVSAEGSGNVGANNALCTSGSKATGALALVGDTLKGILAVLAGQRVVDHFYGFSLERYLEIPLEVQMNLPILIWWWGPSVALLAAIAGHNYNPWLSLKAGKLVGGKGLATAAGGFLLLTPWLLLVWIAGCAVGIAGFAMWKGTRDVLPGNVVGTVAVPFAAWALYGPAAALVVTGFALLVLPKHVAQVRTLLSDSRDPSLHETAVES